MCVLLVLDVRHGPYVVLVFFGSFLQSHRFTLCQACIFSALSSDVSFSRCIFTCPPGLQAVAGVGGPLPMYNSSDFGKTLLLEALSRITIEDATAQAEDVRKRLPVSVGGVTAACFTFASTFGRLSCVTFSKDATLVRAPCDSASVPF